jgi:hypothetical protein
VAAPGMERVPAAALALREERRWRRTRDRSSSAEKHEREAATAQRVEEVGDRPAGRLLVGPGKRQPHDWIPSNERACGG